MIAPGQTYKFFVKGDSAHFFLTLWKMTTTVIDHEVEMWYCLDLVSGEVEPLCESYLYAAHLNYLRVA